MIANQLSGEQRGEWREEINEKNFDKQKKSSNTAS